MRATACCSRRARVPTWVYDAETLRFLAVNDAAVRHYGWSRAEFLEMRITEIRPEADVEALLAEHPRRARSAAGSRDLAAPASATAR